MSLSNKAKKSSTLFNQIRARFARTENKFRIDTKMGRLQASGKVPLRNLC